MSGTKSDKKAQPPGFGELLASPMVTIKVEGEGGSKSYLVHKSLVMHYSDYFRGALETQNFEEGVSGEVVINDFDPTVVEIFLAWLYHQKLPATTARKGWDECTHEEDYCDIWDYLAKLCVLAHRFIAPELTKAVNAVAKELSAYVPQMLASDPTYDTIVYAFRKLPSNCTFLEYLTETYCILWKSGDQDEYEMDYPLDLPVEFHHRVMRCLIKNKKR